VALLLLLLQLLHRLLAAWHQCPAQTALGLLHACLDMLQTLHM
jgi:hypothetical protein